MKILIDNGHGVDTPGKHSPDGRLMEYAYAREIASGVVLELQRKGIDAVQIVQEETDVPLAERCRRVNAICDKLGTSNVILVSIHCNAAGDGTRWMNARGWEAWTSTGQTKADELAECLYEAAEKSLPGMKIREDVTDGDPDKEAGFYILRRTRCPAVLTENLFQDNREDVEFLLSPEGRRAITGLHVDGICKYLDVNQGKEDHVK